MVAKAGAEQRAKAHTWRGPFLFRERDVGQMELNLLLHDGKEGVLPNKASCELLFDHQPHENAAFLPSARFHPVAARYPLLWGHFEKATARPFSSPAFPEWGGCPEHPYWAHHAQHLLLLNSSWW